MKDNKFNIDDTNAFWSEKGKANVLLGYGADKWAPDYAQAYAVKINPKDFLDLTTSAGANNIKLGKNSKLDGDFKELDVNQFQAESSDMFLEFDWINKNLAKVIGHEGRHRMFALMQKGITSVDIILRPCFDDYDKYNPTNIETLYLIGQFNESVMVKLSGITPISYKNFHK